MLHHPPLLSHKRGRIYIYLYKTQKNISDMSTIFLTGYFDKFAVLNEITIFCFFQHLSQELAVGCENYCGHIRSQSMHLHVQTPGILTAVSLIDVGKVFLSKYSVPLMLILISFKWKWFLHNWQPSISRNFFLLFLGTRNRENSDLQFSIKQ